jgi:polyisoprenoid-binding protein YceI
MLATSLTVSAAVVLMAGFANARSYSTSPSNESDTVYFRSPAKLEFIEGATNKIAGSINMNADSAPAGVTGVFQVDLRTLKTDIDLRDEHMRERHLHTEKYPFAYFTIGAVAGCPQILRPDTTYVVQATGKFYIHGVWRSIAVTAEIGSARFSDEAESIAVRARFSVKLDDFGIPRPKALFLKLAETINIEVIFTAANNLPAPTITLPDWPERK